MGISKSGRNCVAVFCENLMEQQALQCLPATGVVVSSGVGVMR